MTATTGLPAGAVPMAPAQAVPQAPAYTMPMPAGPAPAAMNYGYAMPYPPMAQPVSFQPGYAPVPYGAPMMGMPYQQYRGY
jgi:hypothetical protein